MSKTAELYLDERLEDDLWIKGRAAWPQFADDESLIILTKVAEGLAISKAKLFWAYVDGLKGDDSGWKRLRKRLLSPPVKMVKENGTDKN